VKSNSFEFTDKIPKVAQDIIKGLLSIDPASRISTEQILNSKYLQIVDNKNVTNQVDLYNHFSFKTPRLSVQESEKGEEFTLAKPITKHSNSKQINIEKITVTASTPQLSSNKHTGKILKEITGDVLNFENQPIKSNSYVSKLNLDDLTNSKNKIDCNLDIKNKGLNLISDYLKKSFTEIEDV